VVAAGCLIRRWYLNRRGGILANRIDRVNSQSDFQFSKSYSRNPSSIVENLAGFPSHNNLRDNLDDQTKKPPVMWRGGNGMIAIHGDASTIPGLATKIRTGWMPPGQKSFDGFPSLTEKNKYIEPESKDPDKKLGGERVEEKNEIVIHIPASTTVAPLKTFPVEYPPSSVSAANDVNGDKIAKKQQVLSSSLASSAAAINPDSNEV